MREILFRGKWFDNNEWVEGGFYLEPYTDNAYIIAWNSMGMGFIEYILVCSDTVGQYTGLTDKNGKRIFEGDIIRYQEAVGSVHFGAYASAYEGRNTHMGFYIKWHIDRVLRIDLAFWANERGIEIIGNIHDNPELIAEVHE